MGEADLVVGANGAFSWIRSENEARFGTTIDWRLNRFIWYGSTRAFDSLTLTFRETELGVFCAHHYRYRPDRSTFLVEVEAATWQRAGFETMSPEDTIRYCERVFAKDLDGHRIISNNSQWRQLPGDLERALELRQRRAAGRRAAHGALLDRLGHAPGDGGFRRLVQGLPGSRDERRSRRRLRCSSRQRLPPMKKIWDAANASLRWYEDMDRLVRTLTPVEFAYSYMTRTGSRRSCRSTGAATRALAAGLRGAASRKC